MRFKDKVVVVTASAGAGIGQSTIRSFAREGAKVVVSDMHEKRLNAVADDINKSGGTAIGVRCDVTNKDDVKQLISKTVEKFGRIDILVNNAGLNIDVRPVSETTDETWERILNVNLTGAFYCCRAAVPQMAKQKWGRIINLSSPVAWSSSTDGAPYCCAKAGVLALTRVLAGEVGKDGITVNAICPGAIYNEFYGRDPKVKEWWTNEVIPSVLVGRVGEPQDIANVAMFLAGPDSSFVTGEYIVVSGGRYFH